jgi:hypothetical protein
MKLRRYSLESGKPVLDEEGRFVEFTQMLELYDVVESVLDQWDDVPIGSTNFNLPSLFKPLRDLITNHPDRVKVKSKPKTQVKGKPK